MEFLHKKLPRIVKESRREHAKLKKGRDYQFITGAIALIAVITVNLEAAVASIGAATGLVAAADTAVVAGAAAGGGGALIGAAAGTGLAEAGALAGVAAEGVLAGAGAGLVAGAAIEGGVPSDGLQR